MYIAAKALDEPELNYDQFSLNIKQNLIALKTTNKSFPELCNAFVLRGSVGIQ